jgi:hypothetical protein
MKKPFFASVLVFALAFCSAAAFAASEPFAVKDREWFRQDGGKLSDAPVPNGGEETQAGWMHWLFAAPETSGEAKGAERGIYFYSAQTKKYSFLPRESGGVNAVHFSPDAEMFIVESVAEGETNNITLELYAFAGMTSRFKTVKAAVPPHWIDAGRFAYSRFEPGTSRGRPVDYTNEWMSLAMYDSVAHEETVLKKATETSDFTLAGVSDDGLIVVWEEYVDSPKDWADPDKAKNRELIVPVPPAG